MGNRKYKRKNQNGKKLMDYIFDTSWVQTLSVIITVLVSVITSAYIIHRDIRKDILTVNARTDELYKIHTESVKNQAERADGLYLAFNQALENQTCRTDKLYEMFISLVKENKEKT